MKPRHVMILVAAGIVWSGPLVSAAEMQISTTTRPTSAGVSVEPSGESVQLIKMVLCQDVKDRDPVQELNMTKVGSTVVGWIQVQAAEDTTVTQRWIHDGETAGDIPLPIKGSSAPYRTWARKSITETGNWKWQVLDSKGTVLKEVSFTAAS